MSVTKYLLLSGLIFFGFNITSCDFRFNDRNSANATTILPGENYCRTWNFPVLRTARAIVSPVVRLLVPRQRISQEQYTGFPLIRMTLRIALSPIRLLVPRERVIILNQTREPQLEQSPQLPPGHIHPIYPQNELRPIPNYNRSSNVQILLVKRFPFRSRIIVLSS